MEVCQESSPLSRTLNHCLGKSHNHPPDAADSNAKQAIDKVKQMASTSQTTNHRIGTLPPVTMSRIPGEDAVKKIAQRARTKMNPRPRAGLVLEEEDCRTLRGADMLLYDNGSDERRVIILATSDNLTITEESTSWYLDGTFKSAPQLFYQLLVLHAELTDTHGKSWILPTVCILLTQKDTPIYLVELRGRLQKTSAKISDFQTPPHAFVRACPNFQNHPSSPDVRVRIFKFLHIFQFLQIFIFAH